VISWDDQVTCEAQLTGRRLEHCDFSFFQASVESAHELELYVIWGVRMVEVLWLRPHDVQGTSSYSLHQVDFSILIYEGIDAVRLCTTCFDEGPQLQRIFDGDAALPRTGSNKITT
jgi:hypothetical protein